MLTAIIVAAGSSVRAGFDKTLAMLAGEPVLAHSVRAFQECDEIAQIIIVARAERLTNVRSLAERSPDKITDVVAGGARRQDSVRAGLNRLTEGAKFVAVHDAARPLVTREMISQTYALARAHGAAVLASPVVDTLKRATPERFVSGSVDRANLYAMQTPQIFERTALERAYAAAESDAVEITDEVSALERAGGAVMLALNVDWNFKITFSADLALAETVLQQRRAASR